MDTHDHVQLDTGLQIIVEVKKVNFSLCLTEHHRRLLEERTYMSTNSVIYGGES
jgi:hypothetical protein